ncbi:MAG: hypothetical protein A2Z35_04045 [Actinobacteria bacterium RBG_19FT_COMBO_36_27]|nr:MAG: hypothetical protein A2Z35_04045 [Actinobacteria bacterium RBG_19FT_COMBO_36_27]
MNNEKFINHSDICIIGAGMFGICSAFFLAKKGYQVLIIDKDYISQRASGANPGSLAIQNKHPDALVLLARKAIDIWEYFGNINNKIEYTRCGGFRVAETEDEIKNLKKGQKRQENLGIKVDFFENKELIKMAPYLSTHLFAATYCELDGFADARIAAKEIAKLSIQKGVKYSLRNKVNKIKLKSNKIFLETSQGSIKTEKLILCPGVWLNELLENFGIAIPIDLFINQVLVSAPEKPLIKHIITHVNGNLTVKQSHEGTVLMGGAWQGEGSLNTNEKKPSIYSIKGNSDISCRVIPSIRKFLINRAWCEFHGYTKDRLPLFGKLPGYENIYINGSCSGGFTIAPYMGKLMAELIDKDKTSEDVSNLNPARFIKKETYKKELNQNNSHKLF